MKKIIAVAFIIIIIFFSNNMNNNNIESISTIRFRIIPNSNSLIDQKIKKIIKEYFEKDVFSLINEINSKEEAKKIIVDNIPIMKEEIDNIFKSNNYNMDYNINYGYNYFPKKNIYKEGYYESLVIKVGDAQGDNWWCVLFPNKCLVDINNKNNIYKFWIKEKINNIFIK